ncbi:MAG: response regulator, partial [Terriglobia bacterium]
MKRQKPLILNIDDDEAGRYVAARQLRQNGYDVIESGTGDGGFRMAQTHAPDVILLDVHLPDMDGFEVCRRLRTNAGTEGTPIIQMSASYLDTSAQVKGLENGADAYLTEPYEPRMLLATIHSLLRMKNAEQTVRHSALRWQTTFDAIQDGVALLDPEGRVVQANESFWARVGPDREAAADVTKEGFEQLRSTGKRQAGDRSVGDRVLCIRLDPVFEEGALAGAVCIVQDITEQRTFEQQLRHTAKLESIGVLAGGIAHDFNNLLTGILGNSSLIEETLPPQAPERELIAEVIKASESAADLTRQILAYSGKGRFVMQAVNLSSIALESRAFVKRFIPSRVELVFRTAPDLPMINADAGQMQQLIMNLIINAAESIPEARKGTVLVRTGLEKLESGEYVSLTVTDDGSGMDETTQQRIFDPFFTTKEVGAGT